jgi:hypothetical protein
MERPCRQLSIEPFCFDFEGVCDRFYSPGTKNLSMSINQSINQFHSAHIGDIKVNGNQFLPTKIGCPQAKPEKEAPLNETQVRYGEVLRQ